MKPWIWGACAAALLVAGCGGIGGGTESGVVPAAVAPIGEVQGSRVGTQIGATLSRRQIRTAKDAEYQALEYSRAGQKVTWQSRFSDTRGEISVGQGYQVNRLDCREYTHTIFVGGRAQVARGTACRLPEGTWRIVS